METLREKVKKNIHNLFGGIREFGIGVGLRRYFYYEIFNRYGKCRDKYISAVYNYYESFLKDQIEEYKHKKQECPQGHSCETMAVQKNETYSGD